MNVASCSHVRDVVFLAEPSDNGLQFREMTVVHRREQVMDHLVIQAPAEEMAELATDAEILGSDDLVLVPIDVRDVDDVRKEMVDLSVHHEDYREKQIRDEGERESLPPRHCEERPGVNDADRQYSSEDVRNPA